MKKEQEALLQILSRTIGGGKHAEPGLASGEWQALLRCAEEHEILPIVYDSLCGTEALREVPKEERKKWQSRALSVSIRQIIQTKEFLTLLVHAREAGLDPIVMKGVVVRSLYPMPCLRPSVDEDLLIRPEETEAYHAFLLSEGLLADDGECTPAEREAAAELSYHKKDSPTYIELHKYPFDPASELFGGFNSFFGDVRGRTVRVQIEDVSVRTLPPTAHLMYLFLHAYKHFLHSGIGLRPLCDIGIYAEAYAAEIHWSEIRRNLESVHAFYFAKALLRILQLYIFSDDAFFSRVSDWNLQEADVDALLRDCLESGVHGAASLTRLHSSNMTLHAARNRKGGIRAGYVHAVLHSVFPPLKEMESRYTYLAKRPFLLPAAWLHRSVRYLTGSRKKEDGFEPDNNAAESIRIGRERIRLLRQYRIID